MKIFISQPMKDKTDEEIKAERQNIIEVCKRNYGDDVEIIDSFFEGAPHDATPVWFLGKSLEKLSEADAVYFADGWRYARGCNIEHEVAADYGISIIHDGSEAAE